METNYSVNYEDQRFKDVEQAKDNALTKVDEMYGNMIGNVDQYYNEQINAAQNWADKQAQLQQDRTDFTVEQINQQKAQAQKDYIKEQSGAYVDWQKQSNQYGANAEQMAASGLAGSGFSESSQVSMYNTYQNRVATARESYNNAVLNYNNSIKDAQLQNNAALAEIAYNALQTQLELSLQGFQYKNDLLIAQANARTTTENTYYQRYQDVLAQINSENAMAEQIRQYNEKMLQDQRQFDASLLEDQRQFNETMTFKKEQEAAESTIYTDILKAIQQQNAETPPVQTPAVPEKQTPEQIKAEAGEQSNGSFKDSVANKHTNSTVYIDRVGNLTWDELFKYVKAGKIEQTKDKNGKLKYTWVGDKPVDNPYADEEDDSTSNQPLYIDGHGSVKATAQTVPMTYVDYNGKKQNIKATVYQTKDGKKWIFDPVRYEYVEFTS